MNACDTLKEGFLNNPRECKVRLLEAARARAPTATTLPDRAAAQDRGDVLRRAQEQQGRADLLGPGARQSDARRCAVQPAHPAAATTPCASGASRTPTTTGTRSTSIATCRSSTRRSASSTRSSPDLSQVQGARRQAAALRRLGRHDDHAGEHGSLLRERPRRRWASNQGDFAAPVHGARHGATAAAATARTRSTRSARHGTVAREGRRRRRRCMGTNPQSGLSRPLCPYPQIREVQGHRRSEGRDELGVHRAIERVIKVPESLPTESGQTGPSAWASPALHAGNQLPLEPCRRAASSG